MWVKFAYGPPPFFSAARISSEELVPSFSRSALSMRTLWAETSTCAAPVSSFTSSVTSG